MMMASSKAVISTKSTTGSNNMASRTGST